MLGVSGSTRREKLVHISPLDRSLFSHPPRRRFVLFVLTPRCRKNKGLAHTRLAIIDLSAEGNQPLHDDQDHIHAVITGEIYDHDRLRRECVEAGYRFKGHSDSEVVVALYQRYGAPGFLEHCRGEFSMVVYDDRSGEVFACRDRSGIKPLFYTIVQNELWFSSEVKGFLGMGWKPEWALESIAMGVTQVGSSTIFQGVNRVISRPTQRKVDA